MPRTEAHPRIWKLSHGTDRTTPKLKGRRGQLLRDRILTMHRNTRSPGRSGPSQGELFRNDMRLKDLFYLCHGNSVQLLGRVTSDLLHPSAKWPERGYDVIKRCLPNTSSYDGPKKWWSPSGNTTCWMVLPGELPEFERRILLPFFGLSLDELSKYSGIAHEPRRRTKANPYLGVRPTPFPRNKMPSLPTGVAGKSLLLFDPDRIGKRKAAHEDCLYRFANLFPRDKEWKADYDLLVIADPCVLLVEVKTLRDDARDQLRLALGQLLWYEHFSVVPSFPTHKLFRLVVTDRTPPVEFVDFLEGQRIGSVWLTRHKEISYSEVAGRILDQFGAALAGLP
jgi:hypothetical protein